MNIDCLLTRPAGDNRNRRGVTLWCVVALLVAFRVLSPAAKGEEIWSVTGMGDDDFQLRIRLFEQPFATYSYQDPEISRPYFANIRLPVGIQVTRRHPPRGGDAQDHAELHPGLWLAFGVISGNDYWRLRAPVNHVGFVEPPRATEDRLSFTVENRYLDQAGRREICRETCQYRFQVADDGVLVQWNSTFQSDTGDFYFGDQEEMGLGARVATPIAVRSDPGGRILNSRGNRNEDQVWGKQADWCDYSGNVDGYFVGVMLMPHPNNFRPCWFHARDYGFVAANPFGRRAFTDGEISRVVVRKNEPFSLRFGVLLHWNKQADEFHPAAAYQGYLKAAGQ